MFFNQNHHIGGWLNSLEKNIVKNSDIELSICFYHEKCVSSFILNKSTYYSVQKSGTGTIKGKIFNKFLTVKRKDEKDIPKLLEIINLIKPDVIHIHGTEENFGLIQSYTNIPIVISLQGILTPYIEKYFSGIPFIQAFYHEGVLDKLFMKSVLYIYKDMKQRVCREREILLHAKYVLGRTSWDMRVSSILTCDCLYYTSNEILRDAFYKNQWSKDKFNNPFQIVTIMSGGLYKGLETIVRAANLLKLRGVKFEWIIVGQTENNKLPRIVSRWLGVDYKLLNIKFVGCLDELALVNIMLKSDLYCQVSHIENSPNSVCEAMLIGMPIIASSVGGTDSILENNADGILIQDGDPFALAGSIIEMHSDFKKAKQYASCARLKALSRHNKIEITQKLYNIYQEILKYNIDEK